jgi:hypothetical protein
LNGDCRLQRLFGVEVPDIGMQDRAYFVEGAFNLGMIEQMMEHAWKL